MADRFKTCASCGGILRLAYLPQRGYVYVHKSRGRGRVCRIAKERRALEAERAASKGDR